MSAHWLVNCPYCNAELARGYGHLKVSEVWVPFIRCQICGHLMNTGSKEYLNMTVDERLQLKNNAQTIEEISSSLQRTNQEEYRALLTKYGRIFYPLTDEDEQHFAGIKQFSECKPTVQTTESLYDLGILIKKEVKDERTGGIKQEVLEARQKQYKQTRKIILFSIFSTFVVFCIFGAMIGGANPDLAFLAFFPALATFVAVALGLGKYYESKNKVETAQKEAERQRKEKEIKQKAEQDSATCKTLLEECGMQFFIEYYPQIKRLPIRDIKVSEHYFPEREARLTAAKKISDSGLTECALRYIIETYGDVFSSEVIGNAKTILNEIENEKKEK